MAANERLREILIEVQGLREREAQSLKETGALLDMLEAVATAPNPQEAIRAFLGEVARSLRADAVAVLRIEEGTHSPIAQWPEGAGLIPFDPPSGLGRKFRTFFDLSTVEGWESCFAGQGKGARSLLSAPISHPDGTPGAVMCLNAEANHFAKADARLLRRLSGFAAQILGALQLSAQNALLAAVIDGSSSGFAIADAAAEDMPLVFVNKAFEKMTGYSAEEVLGQNCRFLADDTKDSPARTGLRQAVRQRELGTFLLRNRKKSGERFWNDLTLFPVRDADGTATHMVATQTDASARVALEASQREAQARLAATLSHTNDAFLLILPDGTIGLGNPALRRMFHAPGADWAEGTNFAQNWAAYVAAIPSAQRPDDPNFLRPDFAALAEATEGQSLRLPDGKHVLIRADLTEDGSTVISATDITSLRNTERLLRQRVVAVENASDGIAIADSKGRIIYANPSLARALGTGDEAALVGRKWRNFYTEAEQSDLPASATAMGDAGGTLMQLKHPTEGNRYHETSPTFVPHMGEVVVIRNVTARVVMQERQAELNAQLERSRRREAISQLAAGLAHDFNNLLSAINGSALLIGLEDDASDQVREHASRIGKAGTQAARLVNRLLDLGASGENDSVFDLRSVLTEAEDLVSTNLDPNVSLDIALPEAPMLVSGQTGDASQVMMNLILNANDACSADGGRIAVTLDDARPTSSDAVVGTLRPDQDYARLTVRDDGMGMSPETQDRLFEPYFSTKGAAGTGVGLPMVATIIERAGGAITLTTAPGKGTQFDLYWPVTDTSIATADARDGGADLSGQTLLLLDDEEQVTDVLAAYLEEHGAEVVAVNDPALAVETLLEDGNAWSALITDYDMPDMTGGDVVHRLRDGGCTVPIYVVTALARRLKDPRITQQTVSGIFAKPIDLRQLAHSLADDLPARS